MTGDDRGSDAGPDDEGSEETLSTPRARAPWERKDPADDAVRHSALVGFMSVPMSRRFPVRRSTFLMAVAFIGLATLLYFYPPQSTSTGVVLHTPQGDVFVPNATPVNTTSTTTTAPPATTTTVPAVPPPTTTFPASPSTSTSTSTTTTVSGNGGSGTTGTGNTLGSGSTGTTGTGGAGTTTTTVRTTGPTG